jgi:hypothetical protein
MLKRPDGTYYSETVGTHHKQRIAGVKPTDGPLVARSKVMFVEAVAALNKPRRTVRDDRQAPVVRHTGVATVGSGAGGSGWLILAGILPIGVGLFYGIWVGIGVALGIAGLWIVRVLLEILGEWMGPTVQEWIDVSVYLSGLLLVAAIVIYLLFPATHTWFARKPHVPAQHTAQELLMRISPHPRLHMRQILRLALPGSSRMYHIVDPCESCAAPSACV